MSTFAFDPRDVTAERHASRYAAKMVSNVGEETRRAIRALVTRSIREGIPPLEAARMIRSSIGMTVQQTQQAVLYRASLVASGLQPERVERSYDFFVRKKIRARSESIARTEIMGALNAGSLESWKQAQQGGFLDRGARKKWIIAEDEDACPICRPMHRVEAALNKPFVLPNGRKVQFPPAHTLCRCTIGEPTKRKLDLFTFTGSLAPKWLRTASPVSIEDLAAFELHAQPVYDLTLREGSSLYRAVLKPAEIGSPFSKFTSYAERVSDEFLTTDDREILASGFGSLLGAAVPKTIFRGFKVGEFADPRAAAEALVEYFGELGDKSFGLDGAFQVRVPDSVPWAALSSWGIDWSRVPFPRMDQRQLEASSILDILLANTDRHPGNILLELPGFEKLQAVSIGKFHHLEGAASRILTERAGDVPFHMIDHGYTINDRVPSGRIWGGNTLRRFWRVNPFDRRSAIREISSDASDYWVDRLRTVHEPMLDLMESAGFNQKVEITPFRKRFDGAMSAVSRGLLGRYFFNRFGPWVRPWKLSPQTTVRGPR